MLRWLMPLVVAVLAAGSWLWAFFTRTKPKTNPRQAYVNELKVQRDLGHLRRVEIDRGASALKVELALRYATQLEELGATNAELYERLSDDPRGLSSFLVRAYHKSSVS